ncbi:chloramphenicol phosphotransferase [Rhizobium sp. S152]|uniref:chloramphenicol phosphotransferase CPT family protein n=1 Tax=Rhizobium sp. S152 TaxID=3055038 RepID=UPI0025A9A8EC|nr:chloramphenicol phosphotransferase [Rhizobium sp. S152]MDM9626606.1 chloramphenicol phosphotransferase [Rhizobium sp. S152]
MSSIAARIILLNGVGSSGKSSIARELQRIAGRPFLHVEMDMFLNMLPQAHENHPDAFIYETTADADGLPVVAIKNGPLGERLMKGMRHSIRAMAAQGLDLIVDDVLIGADDVGSREYAELLRPFQFYRVGVFASLEVLEERERKRGDRMLGLARWQFDRVHSGMSYDLELDTSNVSPAECANTIKQRFQL